MHPEMSLGARALATALRLKLKHNRPLARLRGWRAEGWYVLDGDELFSFTTDDRSGPPTNIVHVFQEVEALPQATSTQSEGKRDVCLGFCYGPAEALGFVYSNYRCYTGEDGGTWCK